MNMNCDINVAKDLIRVRFSQMIINEGIKIGEFKIPIHLGLGHEAIAVAVKTVMREEDQLVLMHRNIHYNIAKTEYLIPKIDEYLLKKEGLAKGRLGSMNLANEEEGVIYTSSILGNNLGVGAGLALGQKVKKINGITIIVTGDGAMEEGSFYEALLFLKSNHLASVVIVENNGWSLATRIPERRCDIDLAKYVSAFDIRYERLGGNDVYAYIDKMREIREFVLDKKTPVCVEVDIATLGSWIIKTEEHPEGKFINYHAGSSPAVKFSDQPILENSDTDPIFVLKKHFGEEEFVKIIREVSDCLKDEIDDLYSFHK